MRTCPSCGRHVPPHVSTCPDDGTAIPSPTGAQLPPPSSTAPPQVSGPPGSPPRKPPGSKPTGSPPAEEPPSDKPPRSRGHAEQTPGITTEAWDDVPTAETSSVRAWIGVLLASLVLLGAYGIARERLIGPGEVGDSIEVAEPDEKPAKRSRRSKQKRRRSRSGQAIDDEPVPTFEVDDRVFGDLIAEGERERAMQAQRKLQPVEDDFVPPPEMYQPDGPYSPVASYVEPGARDNVVTLDLSTKGGGTGLLDETEVKRVLRVSALMPCYDEVVQKVPQMRGRVDMRFVVAPDGHVMEATITNSDLRSRQVEACIVRRAKKWRFPASGSRKTRFTTHFDFSSR